MTTLNYSINGLKDLLNDLENLSTCLMSIPLAHVDAAAYQQLREDQLALIQSICTYGTTLQALEKEPDLLKANS